MVRLSANCRLVRVQPPGVLIRLHQVRWLLLLLFLLPQFITRAQNNEILSRTNDDSAISAQAKREALAVILAALPAARSERQPRLSRLLNRAGFLQIQLNSPNEALPTFQESLALVNETADPATKVDALNGVATVYHRQSKCDDAQLVLREALDLADRTSYLAGKGEALLVLSFCQNYSDHGLALKTASEALTLWQSINSKLGVARSFSAMAHYQLAQNNLTGATTSNEAALNVWRELGSTEEEAEVLINLGFIEYRKGSWQSVLSYLTQAQSMIVEEAEPFKMGQVKAGLGEAFLELGLPEISLSKLQEAAQHFADAQNPRSVNAIKWDLGKAYYLMGNNAQAIATLQQTLEAAEAMKDVHLAAMCYDFLGRTALAENDQAAAVRHFETAIERYTQVGDLMEAARARSLMGRSYELTQQFDLARRLHQQSLETFATLTDHLNESATLFALGRLELKQNNLVLAEDYLRRSIAVTEDIRRVSSSSDLTAAFSSTVHDRYESYIECLMRQHQSQPGSDLATRAFELSEQGRARSLSELLRATQTNLAPGVDPQLAEQEKSLRQALRVKEDSKVALLARAYKREELAALDEELARLKQEYEHLREDIRRRYPGYDQISRPTAWSLKDIQDRVVADNDTLLLEYSLGEERGFVWAVTRDHITSYELPAREVILDTARKFHRWLAAKPGTSEEYDQPPPALLSRLVLDPLASELTKRRLIVVADGALNYIPFQVLTTPGQSEPLVANFEVVNAPSASILGGLRREAERRRPNKTLAAFGDPVFASSYAQTKAEANDATLAMMQTGSWQSALRDIELNGDRFDPSVIKRLFYAKRELANLREAAGADSFLASEFDATREKLLSTDLTSYAILHFATHGFLDPKRPENSGLVLSTVDREGKELNGFVGLQDIYQLRAPVDLVVLSACQTGLGKDVRGEGLLGLTRGFMYAGASSVVASLWKVDDEATAELMKEFYGNMLQKGMTPAAALREAQNTIRQRPEWSSPYYWAAFTLQGEYRQVIAPSTSQDSYRTKIVVGALVMVLLVCAGWFLRKRYSTVKK